MATLPKCTRLGIALELTQFTKPGRISQWVERTSEAGQLLAKAGWRETDKRITVIEVETTV